MTNSSDRLPDGIEGVGASPIVERLRSATNWLRHARTRDLARRYLAPFLADEGLTGQQLNRQASKVYDAAVEALCASAGETHRVRTTKIDLVEDEHATVSEANRDAQQPPATHPKGDS